MARQTLSQGRPRLIRPPGSGLLCALLPGVLAAVLLWLGVSHYTRKETVPGYLQTSDVIKRVYPGVAGTIDQVYVKVGQRVHRHQLLASLHISSSMTEKDRERLLAEYDKQIIDVRSRIAATDISARNQRQAITTKISATRRALRHVERIRRLQAQKVTQLSKTRELARPLFDAGQLSRLEWSKFSEAVLNAQQQLERLNAESSAQQDRIESLGFQRRKLDIDARSKKAALKQEVSRIIQSRHSLEARKTSKIRASVNGEIAEAFVQAGDNVTVTKPAFSIVPGNAHLVARLLIPSTAIGRIHTGQPVTLLYDAFPYEQYGTFPGRLTRLSRHALLPGDTSVALPGHQPYFEAIAHIEHPWVTANGKRLPLRAGMSLKADLLLDRRSLLVWMIDPLAALRARDP